MHTPLSRRPMVRRTDPDTSRESAASVKDELGAIQRLVLQHFRSRGPMTARVAESLNAFREYHPNTIRKRISELAKSGHLVEDGVDRSGKSPATIYAAAAEPVAATAETLDLFEDAAPGRDPYAEETTR